MNFRVAVKLLKTIGVMLVVWYALLFISRQLVFANISAAAPCAYLANVAGFAKQLKGKSMSRNELEAVLAKANLASSYNRYTYKIEYRDKTNWTVRLLPQSARTYDYPWGIRLLFLETSMTTYPDIEISYDNYEVIRKQR
jgi:hypothetical protein